MSIAEKLIKIAENEPKVYEAGKTSQIQGVEPAEVDASLFGVKLKTIAENTIKVFEKGRADANLQKATASGEIVRVDDVSPIEHKLKVNLTSDALTDFSGVSVTRFGRNLYDANRTVGKSTSGGANTSIRSDFEFDKFYLGLTNNNYYYDYQVNSYTYDGNTFTFNLKTAYYGIGLPIKVKPNTKYATRGIVSDGCAIHSIFYTRGGEWISGLNATATRSFTTPANCETVVLLIIGTAINTEYTASNIQLELGSPATEYEPYKEPQTAFALADGTVNGLTSLSPTMTLIPDTSDVNINLEYYKDK